MFSYKVFLMGTRTTLKPTGKWRLHIYSNYDDQLYIQCEAITSYKDIYKTYLKVFKKFIGKEPIYTLGWYHENQINIVEEPEILEFDCKGE